MTIPPPRTILISGLLFLGIGYPVHVCALSQSKADSPQREMSRPVETIVIPGPLRSFLRMAGISQEISPEDVLHMLARNASLYGYGRGGATEYLVLVDRYVHQARDLQRLV